MRQLQNLCATSRSKRALPPRTVESFRDADKGPFKGETREFRRGPGKARRIGKELPFLMVFLGVVIGTIVAAMFMPIFNMGSLAQ